MNTFLVEIYFDNPQGLIMKYKGDKYHISSPILSKDPNSGLIFRCFVETASHTRP